MIRACHVRSKYTVLTDLKMDKGTFRAETPMGRLLSKCTRASRYKDKYYMANTHLASGGHEPQTKTSDLRDSHMCYC